MRTKALGPTAGKYGEAICPEERCDASLHIEWTLCRPVSLSDGVADLRGPDGAIASRWSSACAEGHTLLLPVGCADDEVFGSEPYAEDGEVRDDLGRLRRLIGVEL